MSMQPPDANTGRSWLAQLLMNIFNGGQSMANPFYGEQKADSGLFPPAPGGGAPLDMTQAGPWGAGTGAPALPETAPAPTPAPQQLPQQAPTPQPKPPQMQGRMNRGMY